MQANVAVTVVLLAVLAIVGGYDIYVSLFYPSEYTITYVIRVWSAQSPAIPLFAGLLFGHLFLTPHIRMPVIDPDHPASVSVSKPNGNRNTGVAAAVPDDVVAPPQDHDR